MADRRPHLSQSPVGAVDWAGLRHRLAQAEHALELNLEPAPEQQKAILRARARVLAQEAKPSRPAAEQVEVVRFQLAQEQYAIESAFVREVWPMKELTPLPGVPSFVLGLVNIRGQILSVIDIKKFFELPEKGLTDLNRVIVLQKGAMEFGVLADVIVGVEHVDVEDLQTGLSTLTGKREEYFKGVTSAGVILLDAERLMEDESLIVHDELQS
ncbi:MAG: purine-binding chemotaxis protein CheW [Candidatus Hydrogenedentes bacterium]|nr:purine-binding chemotaxis protein CheW [Candidatus Hydrogenedentota bacterium]